MEEKVLIKGKKSSAFAICTTAGLIVAVPIFGVCMSIWDPQYYWDMSLVGAIAAGLAVSAIIMFWLSKMEIVVTNKRVYGCVAFGKRVDLPLDSVTAVGTSWLNGIDIATSSGSLKFKMIKNKNEIHALISKLLMERQNRPAGTTTIKQEIPQSNAKELKNYKELLDMGVISQEEFDAKKKQLLGL